ncbi:alpha-glucoside ABC transporter substrate-binding protein [Microbacterium sorbitolivorans]|uniref:Carbohydrate ABC transporter substrate-binding protein n=1 Tax=Microbacterium sorbitolivorans TaxID=1867410 RepID=A0A367Y0L0_9MICO|nr:ABC transporter substrate-binding protein [Microbacterium sorbitolivorans]RCK58592.1 carbohydrate ABC transporter substrate-binding protein [Microbacterium sorbitolivorans]GGF37773.1 alpha-glucoside ABC transporter substrate-binding protein [Microbacterium sorbitolivorans]
MTTITMRRAGMSLAGGLVAVLALAGCAGDDLGGGSGGNSNSGGSGGGDTSADCAAYESYGTFDGDTVKISSTIEGTEGEMLEQSWADFASCTGITIEHNPSNDFESQIFVQVEGGNAPDLAIFPQPGLLSRMVDGDYLKPLEGDALSAAEANYTEDWLSYGNVDGTQYGIPIQGSAKSFVWYSPSVFEENGYEIPTTWDELMALSDQISADHGSDSVKPWCFGIESGGATGWPATDFMEDMVLREAGADVYDQWVNHEIPFDDPQIVASLERAGDILQNEDYVNGGIGDSRSIATTPWADAGLQILNDNCFMFRAASFFEAQLPEGTDVGPDGDIFAFYLPADTADDKPLLIAGDYLAAFSDSPATQAVEAYMASPEWANARMEIGGMVSPNSGADPSKASSDVLRLTIDLFQDEGATARFDGSDLMPSQVGAGSFWSELTNWIDGQETAAEALAKVEASWP